MLNREKLNLKLFFRKLALKKILDLPFGQRLEGSAKLCWFLEKPADFIHRTLSGY